MAHTLREAFLEALKGQLEAQKKQGITPVPKQVVSLGHEFEISEVKEVERTHPDKEKFLEVKVLNLRTFEEDTLWIF